MLKFIDFYARRVVAYPLVLIGYGLTMLAHPFILIGAWLMDREDVLKDLE